MQAAAIEQLLRPLEIFAIDEYARIADRTKFFYPTHPADALVEGGL
jgi:hypothetical protein